MNIQSIKDNEYQAKLKDLQVEQAGLNRRIKAQRERANQITVEFFAIKAQWRAECGPVGGL